MVTWDSEKGAVAQSPVWASDGRRSGNKTAFLDQLKRKRRRAPIQLFIDTFTAEFAEGGARFMSGKTNHADMMSTLRVRGGRCGRNETVIGKVPYNVEDWR